MTRDLFPDGFRYGGAVLYGGLTASRLGFQVELLTSSAETEIQEFFPEISICNMPSSQTTLFRNEQKIHCSGLGDRVQTVSGQALPIPADLLKEAAAGADIVHIAPVLHEIEPADLAGLTAHFLVANPQGWFRQVDANGIVRAVSPSDIETWPHFHAVVLSENDIARDWGLAEELAAITDLLVVTRGAAGAKAYYQGVIWDLEAHAASRVVDTTGAGDIFAAALFSALYYGNHPLKALEFASCLAAQGLARFGLDSVPGEDEIRRCLSRTGCDIPPLFRVL